MVRVEGIAPGAWMVMRPVYAPGGSAVALTVTVSLAGVSPALGETLSHVPPPPATPAEVLTLACHEVPAMPPICNDWLSMSSVGTKKLKPAAGLTDTVAAKAGADEETSRMR